MLPGFQRIVEERIQKAQREGVFENLIGSGKPLVFEDDRFIPEELRLAFKILKNAGCVPPEIEIKKEIHSTEELLAGMGETAEKYHTLKKLNFLILKLNAMRNSPVVFEVPQQYQEKLAERFGSNDSVDKKKTARGGS